MIDPTDPHDLTAVDQSAVRLFDEASDNAMTISPHSTAFRGEDFDEAEARALAVASAVLALVAEVRASRLAVVDAMTRTARRERNRT